MTKKFNLRFFIVSILLLFSLVAIVPAFAQNVSATPGFDVEVTSNGVSVYRVNADGSRTLIVFVPAAAPTSAQTAAGVSPMDSTLEVFPDGFLIVNVSHLNMRSGDGPGYTVVKVVDGGNRLDILGRNADRSWWFVEHNGARGWVNNVHVVVRGNLTDVPLVQSAGTLIQPSLYIGYDGNGLFGSLPHNGEWVCTLPGKSEHPIVGRSEGSNWYQIEATCKDGTEIVGWIQADRGIVRNPAGTFIPITNV